MKSFSTLQIAAAAILGVASVAQAQSLCAVTCFQKVITDHPPLSCKEANMYLCFCKSKDLQGYFLDCVYKDCPAESESAVGFGVNLCSELGAPITVPPRVTSSSAAAQVASSSAPPAAASSSALAASSAAAAAAPAAVSSAAAPAGSSAAAAAAAPVSSSQASQSAPAAASSAQPSMSKASAPSQAANSTTPGGSKPTNVSVSMGMGLMVAPGLLAGAAAAAAALQLL